MIPIPSNKKEKMIWLCLTKVCRWGLEQMPFLCLYFGIIELLCVCVCVCVCVFDLQSSIFNEYIELELFVLAMIIRVEVRMFTND